MALGTECFLLCSPFIESENQLEKAQNTILPIFREDRNQCPAVCLEVLGLKKNRKQSESPEKIADPATGPQDWKSLFVSAPPIFRRPSYQAADCLW